MNLLPWANIASVAGESPLAGIHTKDSVQKGVGSGESPKWSLSMRSPGFFFSGFLLTLFPLVLLPPARGQNRTNIVESAPTPAIAGLTVVKAPDGVVVGPLSDGFVYDPGQSMSVRADLISGASVVYELDGAPIETEHFAPFAVAGDDGGRLNPWRPSPGRHVLKATPMDDGVSGPPVVINFIVPQLSITALTVVETSDGTIVSLLTNGFVYDPTQNLSVRADLVAGTSVLFELDGQTVATERFAPFAVAGDDAGQLNPWTPSPGPHVLTVTPMSNGIRGQPVMAAFTVLTPPNSAAGSTTDPVTLSWSYDAAGSAAVDFKIYYSYQGLALHGLDYATLYVGAAQSIRLNPDRTLYPYTFYVVAVCYFHDANGNWISNEGGLSDPVTLFRPPD